MDKCILVQYLSSVNSVITETFKSTHRIKLTCFDVSLDYIVFGASSGGIYIFRREPCEFLKIIPSKEGSAIKIVISPNGKNVAIASSKGLIIVLEDFLDTYVRPLIHSEHEGSIVTAIKWHGNIIYSGDNVGRVAIFSLSNLPTIFQAPPSTIMRLDSNIIQIDAYLNYFLVSTKTRTCLCNTEKESYKQIGKKLRDGNFGACFLNVANNDSPDACPHFKGTFKTIKENESFITTLDNSDVNIYCARPGARLWKANFDGTVLVTHQFRDSLNQSPSDLLHLEDVTDARMNVATFTDVEGIPKNFNFGKIHPLLCRFIFTYDDNNIYFFDPGVGKLAFWSNCFKGIKDIVILGSLVYIWQDNLHLNTVSLELLEELIIKTLLNKQYYFCAELCTTYSDYVIDLIEYSKKIHLITILKSKLTDTDATELLEKLLPILHILEKFNKQIAAKKLKNGIVVIGNSYPGALDYDNVYIPESVTHIENSSISDELKTISHDAMESASEPISCVATEQQAEDIEENINLLALYKQFQLNKTHKSAELTEATILMDKLSLNDLLTLFNNFIKYVLNLEQSDPSRWCKEQFLKQASRKDFDVKAMDENTLDFLSDAFLESSKSSDLSCKCNFPLPKAHRYRPKYYNLGCKILNYSKNIDMYLINIPYMHKYVLSKTKLNEILSNLSLIVQFNDQEVFEHFLMLFTYDTWDEFIKLHIKLRKGKCLNCELSIEVDDICPWSNLGMLMIRSIGPQNTTRLLKRYSQYIPNGSLDTKFYQSCILASTFDEPGLAVDFTNRILGESTLPKFEDQMEKFLQRNYLGCQNPAVKPSVTDVTKCVYCDIPLEGPILTGRKCDCGHNFHSLCFAHNNRICSICSKK